jgi:hypothetical protein
VRLDSEAEPCYTLQRCSWRVTRHPEKARLWCSCRSQDCPIDLGKRRPHERDSSSRGCGYGAGLAIVRWPARNIARAVTETSVDQTRFCGRRIVKGRERGSFSRYRIWKVLAVDRELAPASPPARLATTGAGGGWAGCRPRLGTHALSYALPP